MTEKINHRAPQSSDKLEISKAKTKSVGMPAILESFRHMQRYMDMPKALKASMKMNQKGGFDCPGCAWPDPEDKRSVIAEYCENGIKAMVEEATNARADVEFWSKYSVAELSAKSDFELGKSGRITNPMYLKKGGTHYEKIEWEEAFKLIGKHLNALESPNQALFYTSGRTSNEAAFLYGAFVRAYGTNNLPDCSNMCHESSGTALSKTVGVGKGSVTLNDLHEAELIIVMGQNPGTNHPRMLSALEDCKDNGGKIVAINPLKEAGLLHYTNPQRAGRMLKGGLQIADIYLQVHVNGDLALLKIIIYKLWEKEVNGEEVFDKEFIENYTKGYEEFTANISSTNVQECLAICGLKEGDINELVQLIADRKKIIVCWAMGITQHVNGVATIQEIVNLLLLKGSIGKHGAGTCPVRGHSNVQGDRTMGIWEKMNKNFHTRLGQAFGFDSPTDHGLDTVDSIKAMHKGQAKVFFGMGGNFLSATPDTDMVATGLQSCELTVHVSTKPNRSHLVHGKEALILPCKGRTEIDEQSTGYQFVSVENSMGKVSSSKGVLQPISDQLMSEVEIVANMAHHTLSSKYHHINWLEYSTDYDLIRDKIEQVVGGFKNYNQRIREPEGFYLPNVARNREFLADGKALFTVNKLEMAKYQAGEFVLTTIRAHDQYNTTIYGLNDRYRGIENGRKIIMMNMQDMIDAGIQQEEKVDITSIFKGEKRMIYGFKAIPYDIPKGSIAAYFPEANPLVPIDHVAKESNTPSSKSIKVRVTKSTKN